MKPRDFFSESRSRRLHMWVTAYCFESLNIGKKLLGKTSINQRVFCQLYFQVRNNQNRSEKAKNSIKIQLRTDGDIF